MPAPSSSRAIVIHRSASIVSFPVWVIASRMRQAAQQLSERLKGVAFVVILLRPDYRRSTRFRPAFTCMSSLRFRRREAAGGAPGSRALPGGAAAAIPGAGGGGKAEGRRKNAEGAAGGAWLSGHAGLS